MPTPTYVPIATTTLATNTATITFSSIVSSYRDIVLVISGSDTVGGNLPLIRFNGDSGTNYSFVRAISYGVVQSSQGTGFTSTWDLAAINIAQSTIIVNIMDYSATDKHKVAMARTNSNSAEVWMGLARWANTSAINQIGLSLISGNYRAGTTISLYGIAS